MADSNPAIEAAQSMLSALGATLQNVNKGTQDTQTALSELGSELIRNSKGVASLAEAYVRYRVETSNAADALRGAFGDFQNLALMPKEFAAAIAGGNIFAINQTEGYVKQQAQIIQDNMYKVMDRLETDVIQVGEGVPVMLNTLYKNAAQLEQSYFDNVLRESRLFVPAVEALQRENAFQMAKTTQLLTDGLRVNAETVTALFQEEFSKTGKISGEFAEKFAADIIAAEKVTGQNRMVLAEDFGEMLRKVDVFGNSTNAQILALSANMSKLGLDTTDVISVLGKFSAFDQAASAVGNLSTITGAALDTMNLFYLANSGDKLGFFQSLRQQLLDSGVAIENLSLQEQSYLSKQLGFSSVRQLQSFLNSDIEMTAENLAELIETESDAAGLRGAALDDELAKSGGMSAKAQQAVNNAQEAYENTLKLAAASSEMARSIQQINIDAARNVAEGGGIALMVKGGQAIGTALSDSSALASGAFATISAAINDFIAKGDLTKLRDAFRFLTRQSMPPIWADIIAGVEMATPELKAKIAQLTDGMKMGAVDANAELKALSDTTSKQIAASFADLKAKVYKEDDEGYAKFVEGVLSKQKSVEDKVSALADVAEVAKATGLNTEGIIKSLEEAAEKQQLTLTTGQLSRLAGAATPTDRDVVTAAIAGDVIGRAVVAEVDKAILAAGKKPETGTPEVPATPGSPEKATNVSINVSPTGNMKGELTIKFDSGVVKGLVEEQVIAMVVNGFTLNNEQSTVAGLGAGGQDVKISITPNTATA